jgi:chitinase
MIWISLELKSRHPGFLVTAPPAPWNQIDQTFCKTMVEAGAMDYVAPQYYDGPNLATQSYVTQNVDLWADLVGAEHLVVGFGIWDQPNYMAIGDAVATWNAVEQKHPKLRGAFDWQIHIDEGNGWSFASQIGPLVTQ